MCLNTNHTVNTFLSFVCWKFLWHKIIFIILYRRQWLYFFNDMMKLIFRCSKVKIEISTKFIWYAHASNNIRMQWRIELFFQTSKFGCADARPYSCDKPCGRLLACGNHTCQLQCHVVTGAADDSSAGENCQTCEVGCERVRPGGCSHACLSPCHKGLLNTSDMIYGFMSYTFLSCVISWFLWHLQVSRVVSHLFRFWDF